MNEATFGCPFLPTNTTECAEYWTRAAEIERNFSTLFTYFFVCVYLLIAAICVGTRCGWIATEPIEDKKPRSLTLEERVTRLEAVIKCE